MEWLKSLTKIQVVVLLIIGGISSLIALEGLSQTYRDYYVSAAISRAFFSAIIMLVITSPFLYLFRKKPKQEKPKLQKPNIRMKRILIVVSILIFFGLLTGASAYYLDSQSARSSQKTACAQVKIENPQVEKMHVMFDPMTPPKGAQFYKQGKALVTPSDKPDGGMTVSEYLDQKYPERAIWTETNFDVDGDGSSERILTADIAMNHTPHLLKIVKDGYVIFEYEGAGVSAEEIEDHKGFTLWETTDWNKNIRKATRYEYNSSGRLSTGGFTPIWYQEGCTNLS